MNLLLKKRHDRIYPILESGDKVKIFRKKRRARKSAQQFGATNIIAL